VLVVLGPALLLAQDKPLAGAKQDPGPAPGKAYAGSESCALCHEDISKSYAKNRHHAAEVSGKWKGQSCEACHGAGAKHAESADAKDIVNPAKMQAFDQNKACNTCHFNQQTLVGRIQSGHARSLVSCTACHPVHAQPAERQTRSQAINETCKTCHVTQWAEFQRPHRHPLNERAMSCADCHNPHGGPKPKMMRTVNANEPNCFRCHGDKRGPFAFEHAPVRLENCNICHEPHGSANPRMLTRHEERFLCLECHANVGNRSLQTNTIGGVPPALHDLRSPRFRSCSTCHIKVHGSQASRSLMR
jgi:DmsE family decaheme c-type cytochrome